MTSQTLKSNLNYFIIAIILCWVTINLNLNKHSSQIIQYDTAGYYAYLPAIFIYGDLQFNFFERIKSKYSPDKFRGDYRYTLSSGKVVNKYFIGTAVLESPFFAFGHLATIITGNEKDGYSYWYMVGLALSSIFYTLIGLIFFAKVLEKYKVTSVNKWLVIYSVTFGTNVFVYAAIDPGMSHPCSFACINALAWCFILFKETGKSGYFLLMVMLIGLTILIRPINLIVIFGLLFFLESFNDIVSITLKIRRLGLKVILGFLLVLAIGFIQILIYKIQTDQWIVYSYGNEKFNFGNPEITNFLFSYRKGYFLYTPIALLSILCLFDYYKENKFRVLMLLSFLIVLVYVFSSWWCWWYGGSFSSRVMLEYSLFIFLPLGLVLKKASGLFRKMLIGTLLVFIIFCQIQIYQFRYYQIHYSDTTKEMYWENFLRIDKLKSNSPDIKN